MPTRGSSRPDVVLDTSAAVALVVADHEDHAVTVEKLAGRRLGFSGHAGFQTYSVLTRLPPPARRDRSTVAEIVAANLPSSLFLSEREASSLTGRLADLGI